MKAFTRTVLLAAVVLFASLNCAALTHKSSYSQPCNTVWSSVKDVLKTSGKYQIISISSEDMSASFAVGGFWTGKMIDSVLLMSQGTGCEMSVTTQFRGITHSDADDFKTRVDNDLVQTGAVTQSK